MFAEQEFGTALLQRADALAEIAGGGCGVLGEEGGGDEGEGEDGKQTTAFFHDGSPRVLVMD